VPEALLLALLPLRLAYEGQNPLVPSTQCCTGSVVAMPGSLTALSLPLSYCTCAASAQASLDNLHAAAAAGHAATEHRRPAPEAPARPTQRVHSPPPVHLAGQHAIRFTIWIRSWVSSCAAGLSHFLDAECSLGQNNIDQCLFWELPPRRGPALSASAPPPFPLPIVTLVVALGERGLPCVAARV
jgi:hypothetical protein